MREELRGDEIAMPFWVNNRQRIKWLTFWDPVDPASDPLAIPLGAKPLGGGFVPTGIENIEEANTAFDDPAGAHTGCLTNPAVGGAERFPAEPVREARDAPPLVPVDGEGSVGVRTLRPEGSNRGRSQSRSLDLRALARRLPPGEPRITTFGAVPFGLPSAR